jgi:hypothetical protein
MTIKLTDRFLASRKAPVAGRDIYTDATMPGLAFRVSAATQSNPEGRRDWLLRYRPRQQAQRAVALGTYPAVSLSKARQRAGEIVAAAKRGVDLITAEEREAEAERVAEAKARPLREIANSYLLIALSAYGHGGTSKVAPAATLSRSSAANRWVRLPGPMWSNFSTAWNASKACDTKLTAAGKLCG